MQSKKKIVMTGGHAASTAYAVISEIKEKKKDWEIHFIGGRSSLEGKKVKPLHTITLKGTDINYHNIITGRIQRKFTIWTIPSLIKIPFGFLHAFYLILKIRPNLILSFGGYAAFPVVVVSWLLRKKVIVHEQTAAAGRANLFSSRFADKIAISRESSREFFPKEKTVLTGNPISLQVAKLNLKNKISKTPIIFVTGGASGSVTINECIEKVLKEVLQKNKLIHQTGELQYEKYERIKNDLPKKLQSKYVVKSVISSQEWPEYLEKADVIVSRSGANMVAELIQIKRPAILIPLPIAYLDEQKKNAEFAKNIGFVKVIEQKDLSPEVLITSIVKLVDNWEDYFNKVKNYESPDSLAGKRVVQLLQNNL